MADRYIKQLFNMCLYFIYPGIKKFVGFTRIFEDKMIMLFIEGRFFELGVVGAKLVLGRKPAIQQEFNGVI